MSSKFGQAAGPKAKRFSGPAAYQGGFMKYGKRFLTILFAMFMFTGALVVSAQAQGRVIVRRPAVVHRVYRPYWGARNWGYGRYYYDPFYADLYKSPYERYLEERYYAQRELA